ncbi:uncharacterized protein TNCV_3551761 [Trichonephila clavipes]|nr:uncharacterized protein TNCV_3551761 [Trichonephila clavipes]
MKQKQQTKNKHSGPSSRSDQRPVDIQNRLKSTLEGKINRIETFIESANEETDSVEIKVKLRSLIQLKKNAEELRNNYYAIPNVKDAELTAVDEDLHLLGVRLESLEVRIETILNSSKKSSSGAVMKTNDNFEIKTKIPPLVLPEFSGKYAEFSSFKIQFDDLITNNILLSESQKLYYLRSCLTHEVNYLCSNFDNFDSLYEFLEKRYENERLIINIHIQNILKLEKIQNENSTEIRNMIDCVQKNLRASKVLKYEQNKLSDVLLINILVEKLDRESRKNFELSHKSKTVPTFQEFIEFLEQRESVLLSVSVDRNAKVNPNKMNKKEKIKTPVSGLNGLSQNIKWKLKTIISNEDSSFAEPVDFLIVDKITEFTPSSSLDISNVEIPKFLTLADKSFYEANEVHALISADIFCKVLKQNTYKVNEELFFKENEFGWIACGKLEERQTNKQGQCFLVNNDSIQDTLKLFFDLEGLGIRDDPVLHERDQALEIFKETVEFEKGRYIVQLPFRKSYNELSDNYPLAKQRFQNLWRRFGHDSELYQQYREIIRDYTEQGIIEEVKTEITDNKLKRPVYYLPHQAIRKDGRLTSKTRIVFDAGSHQNNELSLNDCLWPGINLNPNLLDILINFRLNAIAFCSDIKQAFLQICLADEHKDAVRFLWSDDEPCVHKRPKLQEYRFNRVNFGVSSSPFLLAATIRHHIEKYKHEFPHTVELLDRNFYVDERERERSYFRW